MSAMTSLFILAYRIFSISQKRNNMRSFRIMKKFRIAMFCLSSLFRSLVIRSQQGLPHLKVLAPHCLCVTLVCGNQDHPAIKQRLIDSSRYFDAMFNGYFKEKYLDRITLKGVQPWELEIILDETHHADSGEISISSLSFRNRLQLLLTSDMLFIKALYVKCRKAITTAIQSLSVQDVILVWDIAERIGDFELLSSVMEYAVDYEANKGHFPLKFAELSWESRFLTFIRDIINNNNCPQETKSYRTVVTPVNFLVSWVCHDPNRRINYFDQSESKILLTCVPCIYVFSLIRKKYFKGIERIFDLSFFELEENTLERELLNDYSPYRVLLGAVALDGEINHHPQLLFLELCPLLQLYNLNGNCSDIKTAVHFLSKKDQLFLVSSNLKEIAVDMFDFMYGHWRRLSEYLQKGFVPKSCVISHSKIYILLVQVADRNGLTSVSERKVVFYSLDRDEWCIVVNFIPVDCRIQKLVCPHNQAFGVAHIAVDMPVAAGDTHTIDHKFFLSSIDPTHERFMEETATDYLERDVTLTPGDILDIHLSFDFFVTSFSTFIVFLTRRLLFLCDPINRKMFLSGQTLNAYELCRNAVSFCTKNESLWCICNSSETLIELGLSEEQGVLWEKKYSMTFPEIHLDFVKRNQNNLSLLQFEFSP